MVKTVTVHISVGLIILSAILLACNKILLSGRAIVEVASRSFLTEEALVHF